MPTQNTQDAALLFSTSGSDTTVSRFKQATESAVTREGDKQGRVWGGKAKQGDVLVHEIGRTTEVMALHAVATAVAAGKVFSPEALIPAFIEAGTLPALKKAVDAAIKQMQEAAPLK